MTRNISGILSSMDKDPNGKNQHEPGAKLDAGKIRPGLMFADFAGALMEVAKVSTYGAAKYTDHGWRTVPDGLRRYSDALSRHILAAATGETHDPESGLTHMAHAAWNILAVIQLQQNEGTKDENQLEIDFAAQGIRSTVRELTVECASCGHDKPDHGVGCPEDKNPRCGRCGRRDCSCYQGGKPDA